MQLSYLIHLRDQPRFRIPYADYEQGGEFLFGNADMGIHQSGMFFVKKFWAGENKLLVWPVKESMVIKPRRARGTPHMSKKTAKEYATWSF